ncbi:MAG: GreA/GreB family elongation factor, partial [Hyphomicrobium sp.]
AMAATAREVRYWGARLASAELVPAPADTERVHFGSTVTIERADGRRQTYRIVGEDEADPGKGSISYVSPLARQLAGKEVGDTIRIAGADAEIVEVR